MNMAEMVNGLTEAQLGELGDALKDLPGGKLARVLMHLTKKHRLPGKTEYHIIIATRQLIAGTQPNLSGEELMSVERQMIG